MSPASRTVAVVGDRSPGFAPHDTIHDAVRLADELRGTSTELEWLATDAAETADLARFDGVWVAPGSPYRSLAGALRVIEHARAGGTPLLGTCGGFQHVVLEYARTVLGVVDAAHAEYDPYASELFVSATSCRLAGERFGIRLVPGTRTEGLYAAHGVGQPTEEYYCNFTLTPERTPELEKAGLAVAAVDDTGEARVLELPGHPFYVATLFVPQTTPAVHPVVDGFVRAVQDARS